uniref:Uncharacterized protein n=1 Tax=Avena sativa TaxID=4498 RepID=A0ACD5ZY91_AVESA
MRQFGLFQETPLPYKDTSTALHGLDKIKQKREKNWPAYHHKYIQKWYARIEEIENPNAVSHPEVLHDAAAFNRYLVWLGGVSRLYLQPSAFTSDDIVEDPYPAFDELSQLEYNRLVRSGRGANSVGVIRFVREEISKHVDDATLKHPPGKGSESALREFVEQSPVEIFQPPPFFLSLLPFLVPFLDQLSYFIIPLLHPPHSLLPYCGVAHTVPIIVLLGGVAVVTHITEDVEEEPIWGVVAIALG